MNEKKLFSIGETAKKLETTVRTLQYYDKIGLLSPQAMSEGGRRLYSEKDMVKLHYILSMKQLGFSLDNIKKDMIQLDTPDEVIYALEKQKSIIDLQLKKLSRVKKSISALQKEVRLIGKVDFEKYATIVTMLLNNKDGYWAVKIFDEKLQRHIKERFGDDPEKGFEIFESMKELTNEAALLVDSNKDPKSDKWQEIAVRFWKLVMDFTGGDLSLIPEIEKNTKDKSGWDKELRDKYQKADELIEKSLGIYLEGEFTDE